MVQDGGTGYRLISGVFEGVGSFGEGTKWWKWGSCVIPVRLLRMKRAGVFFLFGSLFHFLEGKLKDSFTSLSAFFFLFNMQIHRVPLLSVSLSFFLRLG